MNNTQKTAETLTERPIYHRIGLFLIKQKPLTLAQVWEIGSVVENIKEVKVNEDTLTITAALERYADISMCSKVVNIMLFRSRWKRWLFGRYIRNHMTMQKYEKVMMYGMTALHASFFLTSLTFLAGTKKMTSPTNTDYLTARGDS